MHNQFKTIYHSLSNFIKDPAIDNNIISTLKEKLKIFFILLLFELILVLFIRIIIVGLDRIDLISLKDHEVYLLIKNYSVLFSITLIVLIIPFLEELVFRLHLRLNEKYIHFNIIIIISGIIVLLLPALKIYYLKISILSFGILLILFYFINKAKYDTIILNIWSRKYFYVIYITLLAFGVLHITNYSKGFFTYLLLPLLVLPQVFLGMFCSFIRLRLGFYWGFIFHASHNFVFTIPILMFALLPISYKNPVEIVEQNSFNVMNYYKISNDTIVFDRLKIIDILPKLIGLKEDYIEYENLKIADKILTIKYARGNKESSGGLKSSCSIVLYELLRKFNLKIEKKFIEKEIFYLQIANPKKLLANIQNKKNKLVKKSSPVWFYNKITLQNADLNFIARTINMNYEQEVVDTLKDNNKYTITIPKLEFDELNKFITDQYGIRLEKSILREEGYKISTIQ